MGVECNAVDSVLFLLAPRLVLELGPLRPHDESAQHDQVVDLRVEEATNKSPVSGVSFLLQWQ